MFNRTVKQPTQRDHVVAAIKRQTSGMPAGMRSNIASVAGLPVSALDDPDKLTLEQLKILVPCIVSDTGIDDEYEFIRAKSPNLNAPAKLKPRSGMAASNPFFAALMSNIVDGEITLTEPERIDADWLSGLSIKLGREDETMRFTDFQPGLVTTPHASAYFCLYLHRLSTSREFPRTFSTLASAIHFEGSARDLCMPSGDGHSRPGARNYNLDLKHAAKGSSAKQLCGRVGHELAHLLSVIEAYKRTPGPRKIVTVKIADEVYATIKSAITGEGTLVVSVEEALACITARTIVHWQNREA
jgi:hypothetical protein